jgi:hypothetical protein
VLLTLALARTLVEQRRAIRGAVAPPAPGRRHAELPT